jgi:hypothetical protein
LSATLFEEVRSEQNLFSAWRHVKRSALNSANKEIRGFAAEFEHQHQKHLRRIARQLREGRFQFDPVKGVLKDKKQRLASNKDPRPIAIATLKNRVVQRGILQVLQPRIARDLRDPETRYLTISDPRLGRINEVNRSKFVVGGLMYPFGGVRPGITLITDAISRGATYFYQSDIKAFFTKIPTSDVVAFVRQETKDDLFADLFAKALEVHLANKDELSTYASLFPAGGIGVAQGASLSAFAGNVLLFDFDHELNLGNGVVAVRYIDDILMVSSSAQELDQAIILAETRLRKFGFALYSPTKGSDKAAKGRCADSFNFLGCTIQPNRCVTSTRSIAKIKSDITTTLSASKAAISESVRRARPLDIRMSQSATLQALGRKIYGWQRSFAFTTDTSPFMALDQFVADQVGDYEGFIHRKLQGLSPNMRMTIFGIPSTADLHGDVQQSHARPSTGLAQPRPRLININDLETVFSKS